MQNPTLLYQDSACSTRLKILHLLIDGRFHSGSDLGAVLNISRAAIWKQIKALTELGFDIYSVKGRGYCLNQPPELLHEPTIKNQFSPQAKQIIKQLDLMFDVDSCNDFLMRSLEQGDIHGHVTLAEYQTKGRGRRGTAWISPPGAGIYLSIGWHFNETPTDLSCLSLSVGVAVVRALRSVALENVGLKWPNDIYCNNRKLGGILIESKGENAGPTDVILGVGINVALPEASRREIDQPSIDIASVLSVIPSRNTLAAALINELFNILVDYQEHGFTKDIDEWRALDCAEGKKAILTTTGQNNIGRVLGIDDNGQLLMSVDGYIQKFTSGQISFKVDD